MMCCRWICLSTFKFEVSVGGIYFGSKLQPSLVPWWVEVKGDLMDATWIGRWIGFISIRSYVQWEVVRGRSSYTKLYRHHHITVSTSVPQFSIHAGSSTASSFDVILSESRFMSLWAIISGVHTVVALVSCTLMDWSEGNWCYPRCIRFSIWFHLHWKVEAKQILKAEVVIKIHRYIIHSCTHKIKLNNFCLRDQSIGCRQWMILINLGN